jgi:hypothetical protein
MLHRSVVSGALAVGALCAGWWWASPAEAAQWVRANDQTNECTWAQYIPGPGPGGLIAQRTIAAGVQGTRAGYYDGVWSLGCTGPDTTNHWIWYWDPDRGQWINPAGGYATSIGGKWNQSLYVVNASGGVYNWNTYWQGWANIPGLLADPNASVDADMDSDVFFGDGARSCIDNGKSVACMEEWSYPSGPVTREVSSWGTFNRSVDRAGGSGNNQVALYYTLAGPNGNVGLYTNDGWATSHQCFASIETARTFADICVVQGHYYGIDAGSQTIFQSNDCVNWSQLDPKKVQALSCDSYSGKVYTVQNNQTWVWQ